MKVPVTEHTRRPWRIHEVAPDFRVLDVWAARAPGAGPDDLPTMRAAITASEEREPDPLLPRLLFAVRVRLGAALGWDTPEQGPGRVTSLVDRLSSDLRQPVAGMPVPGLPLGFTHLYELGDEQAIEIANATVHAVCHFGWVKAREDEYELRMAVLVKTNGLLGQAYMTAIAPFRHLIVYPSLTRRWERAWRDRAVRHRP